MFFITTQMVTKNIPSPIVWQLIFFLGCHMSMGFSGPIDDGLISTIDLTTKFGLA
jgi:hypothetical protein